MLFTFQQKIWFYRAPINFKNQIDGLVILVSGHLKEDPISGQLFIFRNRAGNKIKLLWWDENGFWLSYKRLEKGRFIFPSIHETTLLLTKEQLSLLLAGIDFEKHRFLPKVFAKKFY